MAIIRCPECQTEISSKAYSCPKCGYSFHKKNSPMSIWAFILSFFGCLSLIAIILALIDLIGGDPRYKHTLSGWSCGLSIVLPIFYVFFLILFS